MRANRAAGNLFCSGGYTIDQIAGNQQEVHQHSIGCQRHRTCFRSGAGKIGIGDQQEERPQHDIAVDRKHAADFVHVQYRAPGTDWVQHGIAGKS